VNGGEREIRLDVTQLGAYVLTHFGALVCGCVSGQSQEGRITNCELTVQTAAVQYSLEGWKDCIRLGRGLAFWAGERERLGCTPHYEDLREVRIGMRVCGRGHGKWNRFGVWRCGGTKCDAKNRSLALLSSTFSLHVLRHLGAKFLNAKQSA
jgi:hypothetical protein